MEGEETCFPVIGTSVLTVGVYEYVVFVVSSCLNYIKDNIFSTCGHRQMSYLNIEVKLVLLVLI